MSSISYNNQIPLQQATTTPPPPPPQRYMNQGRCRGGVFGGNNFNRGGNNFNRGGNNFNHGGNNFNNFSNFNYRINQFSYGNNQYNYRNYRNYSNRRNQNTNRGFYPRIFYRRNNYQPQQYYNDYGIINQPVVPQGSFYRRIPRRLSQNRPRSRSNQQRSRSIQQRRRGPRQLRLNDFMPPQLRDPSPDTRNLPSDFNLATATTTNDIPVDALPQCEVFRNNTTQPFVVNQNEQENQQQNRRQQYTSAPFRRRQRRNRQQQYRQNEFVNNNRFAIFADGNNNDPIEIDLIDEEPINIKKNKNSKKTRLYLEPNRMLRWFEDKFKKNPLNSRGNQAYLLAAAPVYDEWIRNNYELQIWQTYLKMGTEQKHWAKEIVQRTKKRDNITNTRFVQKKINRLTEINIEKLTKTIAENVGNIVYEKINNKKSTTTTAAPATSPTTTPTSTAATATNTLKNQVREPIEQLEKYILKYIYTYTQHVKKMAENKIQLAKAQLDEFKALEEFEQIATPSQWNIHLALKPRIKLWSTKNKNYLAALKRVEYDMPPKFIEKVDLSFKIDESIINQDEAQATYNQMRRENELLLNEIKRIIEGFPQENDEGFDAEPGHAAFKHYHNLREKRLNLEAEQSIHFLSEERVEGDTNDPDEHELLKLGPRFIYNDPKTTSRRRTIELATLKRKIEARFFEKKVSPGRPVEQFISELNVLLQKLHNSSTNYQKQKDIVNQNNTYNSLISAIEASQSQNINSRIIIKKKKNYGRLIKRLKYKLYLKNIILQKSDKNKVFHLGKLDDYRKKSEEYMEKTKAYKCLGTEDPFPDLIWRTNKYLLDLRLAKWITQKQYEKLFINPNEVELAHLYYLPKAHKPGTPLRPIISGLKHPTIKISKFLDELLRPLFDQMAAKTTINSGLELVKQLQKWSSINICQETLFCTVDVADLYTMVPQTEGVLSLKKMLDHLKLKQVGGLKIETIIRLSRFVIQNNYFSFNGQFYHQVRGGAMGSPLTLTVANCYMFFYERQIVKQISNSSGLYFRYIDDIFLAINWPARHLFKQIDRWNHFDENIKLSENIGSTADFLDLHIENQDGQLFTTIFQKPSYEPYYLPFHSIHPLHMKKNIIFTMLLRTIRYCSTFQHYLNERERLRIALLLNKYPNKFIDEQFNITLSKLDIIQPLTYNNYTNYRQKVIDSPIKEKVTVDHCKTIFVHFTYCSNMKIFPRKFHTLWNKYFGESPINEVKPILGTRNVNNLQRRLVHTRSIVP
ncbi:unnamed protein product [Rotaria sordida]|uniref:Reverse transcriptase domain-containing protein n=1 Tax=Rotaria sordida TaxID=392033 RepID=A0A815ARJ2_9BILA|nr:unnamed protein product [Rotaria sordida]CAF1540773.1 unnamed protein product [Rotaria sordida]